MAVWGNERDYENYMSAIDEAFDFVDPHERFITRLPKLYKPEYRPVEKNVCVYEDGRIVAAAGSYDNALYVAGKKLKVNGIGNVGVIPSARNKGYMKEIMDFALAEMIKNGTDLSFLGGKRHRYGYFGYCDFGECLHFEFTDASVRHSLGNVPDVLRLVPLEIGDGKTLERILALYDTSLIRADRNIGSLDDTLRTWYNEPYVILKGSDFAGYAVFNDALNDINELRLRDLSDMPMLIKAAFELSGGERLRIDLPRYERSYCDAVYPYYEGYSATHAERVNVLSYRNVIDALLALKASARALCPGSVVLSIHGYAGDERIKIEVGPGGTSVTDTTETADAELTHEEASSLIGSMYSPVASKLPCCCSSWFPLPFNTYHNDQV